MKLALAIVIGAIVIGGTVAAVSLKRGHFADSKATFVRLDPVSEADLTEVISAPGEVQPRDKVSVSAKVAAPILEMPYREGDPIKKGQLLVRLDAKDLEAALRSAEARLHAQEAQLAVSRERISASGATITSSEANLKDALRDLNRQKGLLATSDVSQSVVDTAQTKFDAMAAQIDSARFSLEADKRNLDVETAQLEAAKADVAKAQDDLSYTKMLATLDGVVTRRKADVGEMVVPGIQGSPGTTILEVADLTHMVMVARIDESSIARVEPGQHAKVRMQAFADDVFDGVVERVANARADSSSSSSGAAAASGDSSRYFECWIRLDTRDKPVRSGLAADADIEIKKHHGLRVPSQAVLGRPVEALPADVRAKANVDSSKSSVTVVFRMINGKAVVTPVTVGPSDETHTLVTSGLSAGDQVIVGPYKDLESLTDGQAVTTDLAAAKPMAPAS